MKRSLPTVLLALTAVAYVSPASAAPIAIGDEVKILGSYGSISGGAFRLDNLATGPGEDFLTFCLQMTEYIDYKTTFIVGNISDSADDKPTPDPISLETAWIYTSFLQNLLGTYSSDEIQAAIWYLEDEWTKDVGHSAALRIAASAAVAGGWTNTGVRVLNLFHRDGRPAQDQLVYLPFESDVHAPEPASLVLLASGLLGVAAIARRTRKRTGIR